MTWSELQAALRIFGFSEHDRPTMAQVRRRHRELVKAYHPDQQPGGPDSRIQSINASASVIMEYLNSYRFTFTHDEFLRQNPDEQLREQFAHVWGGSS